MNNEDIKILQEIINRDDINEIYYIIERKEGDTKKFIQAIEHLINRNKELEKILNFISSKLQYDIDKISEKLNNNNKTYNPIERLNTYQIVRLKAIRMKCKELLHLLEE